METVLRKVKVSDRLPDKDHRVLIETIYKDIIQVFYYDSTFNQTQFYSNKKPINNELAEYWYEEVSLYELVKERYEKALTFINENIWYDGDPFDTSSPSLDKDDVIKALKIATGLE